MLLSKSQKTSPVMRKVFLKMLPIQSLAIGLTSINTLINNLIIGNFLGQAELAAIGLLGPFNYILSIFSTMIGVGAQVVCGRYLGKGDHKNLNNTFNTAVCFGVVVGVIINVVMLLFSGPLAGMLGANDELYPFLQDYIRGYAFISIFSVLSMSMIAFLQMESQRLVSTVSVVTLLVLNTVLNLLNIFVFKLGMYGAGLATSIANAVSVLVCVPYFIKRSRLFSFSLSGVRPGILKNIFYLGLPSVTRFACLFVRDRLTNQVVLSLGGTVALSALTVALNVTNAVGCTIEGGFTATVNLISSVLVGERDVKSLRKLGKSVNPPTTLILVVCYATVVIFARPLAFLFGADPRDIAIYTQMICLVNSWFILACFKSCSVSIYTALGRVKMTALINIIDLAAVPIASMGVSLLAGSLIPLELYSIISDIVLICVFIVYYRKKTGEMPPSINEITYVPREFAADKENMLAAEVSNSEEAVKVSQRVIDFCRDKGMSGLDSMLCGLCIEELTVNVLSHGVEKSKNSSGVIDVRAIYENGKMSVMLRDDCIKFDPVEWLEHFHPDKPASAVGIKAVAKASKEMIYSNTLGMNITTIKM